MLAIALAIEILKTALKEKQIEFDPVKQKVTVNAAAKLGVYVERVKYAVMNIDNAIEIGRASGPNSWVTVKRMTYARAVNILSTEGNAYSLEALAVCVIDAYKAKTFEFSEGRIDCPIIQTNGIFRSRNGRFFFKERMDVEPRTINVIKIQKDDEQIVVGEITWAWAIKTVQNYLKREKETHDKAYSMALELGYIQVHDNGAISIDEGEEFDSEGKTYRIEAMGDLFNLVEVSAYRISIANSSRLKQLHAELT